MRVLVFMGSPRKKDSLKVCQEIELYFTMKNVIFEYVFLNDYHVQDCKGCGLCFDKGEKFCPNKDDYIVIKEKLLKADGIIFAAPVYAYQVPAPLKRIIDRGAYLFHRQEFVGKPALIVVSSDGGGHKSVSKYLKMTATGWGCSFSGIINIVAPRFFENKKKTSAWGYDERYHKKMMIKIGRETKKFEEMIKCKNPKAPSLYELFMFNCLRSKTFTSQVDYIFWKDRGWLEAQYFYDTKLNIGKKLFGKLLHAMINLAGSRLQNKVVEK